MYKSEYTLHEWCKINCIMHIPSNYNIANDEYTQSLINKHYTHRK